MWGDRSRHLTFGLSAVSCSPLESHAFRNLNLCQKRGPLGNSRLVPKGSESILLITTPFVSTMVHMFDNWHTQQGCLLMLIATGPKIATRPKGNIWQRAPNVVCPTRILQAVHCNICNKNEPSSLILLNFGQCSAVYSRHGFLSGFVWQQQPRISRSDQNAPF